MKQSWSLSLGQLNRFEISGKAEYKYKSSYISWYDNSAACLPVDMFILSLSYIMQKLLRQILEK